MLTEPENTFDAEAFDDSRLASRRAYGQRHFIRAETSSECPRRSLVSASRIGAGVALYARAFAAIAIALFSIVACGNGNSGAKGSGGAQSGVGGSASGPSGSAGLTSAGGNPSGVGGSGSPGTGGGSAEAGAPAGGAMAGIAGMGGASSTGGSNAGGSAGMANAAGPRLVQNFNQSWKFKRADVSGAEVATFDDTSWDKRRPAAFVQPALLHGVEVLRRLRLVQKALHRPGVVGRQERVSRVPGRVRSGRDLPQRQEGRRAHRRLQRLFDRHHVRPQGPATMSSPFASTTSGTRSSRR